MARPVQWIGTEITQKFQDAGVIMLPTQTINSTITREIPQNYHTFAPKNGQFNDPSDMLGNVGLGHFWQNEIKKNGGWSHLNRGFFWEIASFFWFSSLLILDDFDRVSQAIRMGKL